MSLLVKGLHQTEFSTGLILVIQTSNAALATHIHYPDPYPQTALATRQGAAAQPSALSSELTATKRPLLR